MQWQDVVIATSYVVFNLALLPSIRSKSKPALTTSLMTGFFNLVIAFTQTTLGLWISALATFVNALLWLILAYQKSRIKL